MSDPRADTNLSSSVDDLADWNRNAASYSALAGTPDDTIAQQFHTVLWESLGDVHARDILDVGCGHGWLSAALATAGAHVIGIDGARELLTGAHATYPQITFIEYDLSYGLPPLDRHFDRIIANMVVMDVPEIGPLITAIRHVLKADGRFIFTLPHPCFFNYKTVRDAQTGQLYRRVTGYLQPQVWRIANFGGHNHYHHSLTYYVDQLRANHLAVTRLYEPPHIETAEKLP
jgi:2-polyprenyl-3-methyl-5-hydroxy-6-metoxy-1,4-benzoquinol methylase